MQAQFRNPHWSFTLYFSQRFCKYFNFREENDKPILKHSVAGVDCGAGRNIGSETTNAWLVAGYSGMRRWAEVGKRRHSSVNNLASLLSSLKGHSYQVLLGAKIQCCDSTVPHLAKVHFCFLVHCNRFSLNFLLTCPEARLGACLTKPTRPFPYPRMRRRRREARERARKKVFGGNKLARLPPQWMSAPQVQKYWCNQGTALAPVKVAYDFNSE